jgi:N-hydroxyarylamine O-acetyltransferase
MNTLLERYLPRVGLDGSDLSLEALCRAHVERIPYENLDVRLGREIRLDLDSLVKKLVHGRRGGYCFEHNTLFAAVLDEAGFTVTSHLGRVRVSDTESPRPATHMVLIVDGCAVDVGFGSAVPLGPIPLGGEATYGGITWSCRRLATPEGEEAWGVSLFDMLLFTFTEQRAHAIDYVAPNHLSSTHPQSMFTQSVIVTRWREDGVPVSLNDRTLKERRADGEHDTEIDPADLGTVLREQFLLDLPEQDLGLLQALLGP